MALTSLLGDRYPCLRRPPTCVLANIDGQARAATRTANLVIPMRVPKSLTGSDVRIARSRQRPQRPKTKPEGTLEGEASRERTSLPRLREDEPPASPGDEPRANRFLCTGPRWAWARPPPREFGFRGPFGLRRRLGSDQAPYKWRHPRDSIGSAALSPKSPRAGDRQCGQPLQGLHDTTTRAQRMC